MEESSPIHLDLRAPLEYAEAPGLIPFECLPPADEAAQELLFCFELNHEQAGRIDPDADSFLGEIAFSGKGTDGRRKVQLPAGLYLFAQQRRMLDRGECIGMAIEQQQDGLWERLRLGDRLYIRYLFEDGSPVTQIFRTYSGNC
ncbi:MAG: hypothetical protein LBB89_09235 [Treponema sp.]|jgi:hypothetical protein|nr:hypothetical protein [Treponema sp.]